MAWMALPLHTPTIERIPDESALTDTLKGQQLETGVYVAPGGEEADMSDPDSEFSKRHNAGPIYVLVYQKEGAPVMGPKVLLGGFLIDLLAASLVACMLQCAAGGCCCNGYLARVGFVAGFGVFVALVGHLSYLNWMSFPLGYTIVFCVDVIVGWTLAGLAIAAVIKPINGGKQDGQEKTVALD